ncbi:unnamed protein product [Caenorhabditis bovis]|uniref:Flavin-containing monooxygenase n=1 Tax=Caenorhabditis bovis TaxID=2654633 RepID=A0A8S1F0T3_9PELO|nr:unnamed protein product [Caenorhabditis bovis]
MTKSICVIGAGAAGLITAKHALNENFKVDVFEQTGKVGGTWVYSDEIGCHSSMYKIMKTNLPKEAMHYQDNLFPDDLPSFMSHEHVLEYLENFSRGIPIQFNTTVVGVTRDGDWWKVSTRNSGVENESTYDAVLVCNGHYFEPLIPFENSQIFKGAFLHSHDYRKADAFAGKSVTIIGAGPSGIDICLQVSRVAENVNLIGNKAKYPNMPDNVSQLVKHVETITETGVRTEDGEHIDSDVIIVCTGYAFKFPFLTSELLQVSHNGQVVSPLYQHICHVDYPDSLIFIGIPLSTITFPLFEIQAKFAIALLRGRVLLPDKHAMMDFEKNRMKILSSPNQYHFLMNEQWDYMRELCKLGQFEEWSYLKTLERLFKFIIEQRGKNVVSLKAFLTFRRMKYLQMHRVVIVIQSAVRGFIQRRKHEKIPSSVIAIQAAYRGGDWMV